MTATTSAPGNRRGMFGSVIPKLGGILVAASLTMACAGADEVSDKEKPATDNAQVIDASTLRLALLLRSGYLTSEQLLTARFLVEDRLGTIALFAEHGLLSDEQLAAKVKEIAEVTDFRFLGLLTDEQLNWWNLVRTQPPAPGSSPGRVLRHRAMIKACEKVIEEFSSGRP